MQAAREGLGGEPAWLVGGAVRDRLLGRATTDLDIALAGDPEAAARAVARAGGGTAFELSGAFGAWRVVGRGHGWHVDIVRLRDDDLEADLAARDFTINAMAEPLGGRRAARPARRARRPRGAAAADGQRPALADDPLRTLRAARLATELELALEPATAAEVRLRAPSSSAWRPSACSPS